MLHELAEAGVGFLRADVQRKIALLCLLLPGKRPFVLQPDPAS